MAQRGGPAEQFLGLGQILRHALAQLVGLAQVEHGIGIALGGGGLPFLDRGRIIAAAPGLHSGAGIGRGGGRENHPCGGGEDNQKMLAAHGEFFPV